MHLFCIITVVLTAFTPVFASVQEVWWNLTYVENANPDGLFERRAIGVNGTWPYVSSYYTNLTFCAHY